jgi:hypothetical protein
VSFKDDTLNVNVLKVLQGHKDFVRFVLFIEEPGQEKSRFLVSAGDDRAIRIWNWETGTCIAIIGVTLKVMTMQFQNGILGCGMSSKYNL